MRLTSIKLAGFKSFVDPTHFDVPGQLVGVVGPNGCGKSNIIDAVRWVLGESRASELRGESMQDVIFNGSTTRKPGSRASVELSFDNADGRAAGQWGQYAEIAVKRVLTRDGTSSYYINNLPARRRDIHDIFLGTGLGPRAYAIIGQGMIARIIEARPEDLRIFLEEAAGVSKYKERRRETENRLHDTRENLTRLDDILRELAANLGKLEGQAEVAQRFQALQAEGEQKQHMLWLLRRNEALAEQKRHAQAIDGAQVELDAQTARLREVEAELETLRVAHYAAGDATQAAQRALYEVNAEVSRLEAEIRFTVETRNRAQTQLAQLDAEFGKWRAQGEAAQSALADADEALAAAEERSALAQERAALAHDALPALENRWRAQQQALAQERAAIARAEHALQLETAHQRNADQQVQQLDLRRAKLHTEVQGFDVPEDAELEEARARLEETQSEADRTQAVLAQAQPALAAAEAAQRAALDEAQREAARAQQLDARLQALKALQASVQTADALRPWLARHALEALAPLWQRLRVVPGWENAVEAVLRERLQALEVDDLQRVAALAADAPPTKLAVYAPPSAGVPRETPPGLTPLLAHLRIDDPGLRAVLTDWLGHVYAAATLDAALAARATLPAGACFVVPAGHQVGRSAVQLHAADSEQAGLLAREQEIADLGRECRAHAMLADDARATAERAQAAHARAAQALGDARGAQEAATRAVHALQIDVLKLAQAHERFSARRAQIDEELEDIHARLDEQHAARAEAAAAFAEAEAGLAEAHARVEVAATAFEALDGELTEARAHARILERNASDAGFEESTLVQRIATLHATVALAADEQRRVALAQEQARAELAGLDDHTGQAQLQDALELRAAQEENVSVARVELDALSARLRAADEVRLGTERSLQPLRERIMDLQLKDQAARLAAEQFAEQLSAAGADETVLAARLDEGAKPAYLQGEVTRLNNALNALGPVNMAALDELATARERKHFLDAQAADLASATQTLEDAIRKIDQETRALLQTTFDEVNRHFGELFPKLFGGGQARLAMTGDEILDTGVQVMAQPPGKKNSTIHLLSGGEKALTATALVFAMFQLNPAPFCLLDEVDAPLDDANTERFANLVRAMSEKTQFLFISHNKIAMEMAQQLIGVTMQEQGVSRIVAVDMEAASGLAQNAT